MKNGHIWTVVSSLDGLTTTWFALDELPQQRSEET